MPGAPDPARRALQARLDNLEAQVSALAKQQSQVVTDPTGATGDPAHGHATMVVGNLQPIAGIAGFGVAIWDLQTLTWRQVAPIEAWHLVGAGGQPAFQNSWVNYDAAQVPAQFMRDPFGFVHIEGIVKNGTSSTAVIFTLPPGYRPLFRQRFSWISNNLWAYGSVDSTGDVLLQTAASTAFVTLDGTTFKAEH